MAKIPSFRSLLKQVLHLQESPQRTALAFAIGVFIGFSPAYGLHTVMVIVCAWAFRLNLLALMAGAFLNNPWTVVPILGATYWVGALLLGRSEDSPSFDWHDVSFSAIYEQVMPYAVPFFLGGCVLSLLGAAVAYPLAYFFVAKYRLSHPIHQTEPLPPPQDVR
jgi:uncharacterized protein (DUF2062 family)